MERTITIILDEEEEKILDMLVKAYEKHGFKRTVDQVLEEAIRNGSSWDTYVYEKIASTLWQMQGCSSEESQHLVDSYKQRINDAWENLKLRKSRGARGGEQDVELEPE